MIDAVVTWVDGDDPEHVRKRESHRGQNIHKNAHSATRFASRDEIRYCVWSILTFCPFIRRVFVVTDSQRPRALDDLIRRRPDWADRIQIVDHRDIFREHADLLPVFSSRSIETMLFRIPDLAEHFIYLNDDIFIGRPVNEDHFYRGGLPILQGQMQRFPSPILTRFKAWLKRGPKRAGFKEAQQQAAILVGFRDSYFLAGHCPHPLRRSVLTAFFAEKPGLLRAQAGHRFRSPDQFSPIGLAYHLELQAGAPTSDTTASGYIKPTARHERLTEVLDELRQGQLDSICVQSLDAMQPDAQNMVISALEGWMRITA